MRDPGGEVEGVVVGGLTKRDVERLSAYEGPRYRIAPLKVTIGGELKTVSVFEPKEASFQPVDGAWDSRAVAGPLQAALRRPPAARRFSGRSACSRR